MGGKAQEQTETKVTKRGKRIELPLFGQSGETTIRPAIARRILMASVLRRLLGRNRPQARPRAGKSATPGNTGPDWVQVKTHYREAVGLPREFLHNPDHLADVEQRYLHLLEEHEVIEAIERDEVPIPAKEDRARSTSAIG